MIQRKSNSMIIKPDVSNNHKIPILDLNPQIPVSGLLIMLVGVNINLLSPNSKSRRSIMWGFHLWYSMTMCTI